MATALASQVALAVLDFSGTLSPGAARFGAAARLDDELVRSGLADLGIATPDVFWDALVNPTWQRGSTTTDGYVTVLTDAAVAYLTDRGAATDRGAVRAAVTRFAHGYFAASTIAAPWWPWLRRVAGLPAVTVIIATDHYADATQRVLDQLRAADLPAAGVRRARPGTSVLVANSADVGHHKDTRAFWQAVAAAVGDVRRVVVIDDFGANEPGADAYAADGDVVRRRRATTAVLTDVFRADVTAYPFVVSEDDDLAAAIDRVGALAVAALSRSDR